MNPVSQSRSRGTTFLTRLVRRRYPTGRDITVQSSAIDAIAYEPETSRLDVRFKRGVTYAYGCVTPAEFHAFVDAESKGRFFVKNIRNTHPMMKAG